MTFWLSYHVYLVPEPNKYVFTPNQNQIAVFAPLQSSHIMEVTIRHFGATVQVPDVKKGAVSTMPASVCGGALKSKS